MDRVPRIKWPNLSVKNPTLSQLRAWYRELQKYNETLQAWDAQLEHKESMLNNRELRLAGCYCHQGTCNIHPNQDGMDTGCPCGYVDDECDEDGEPPDYELIGESDPDCGMRQMKAADMKRQSPYWLNFIAGLKPFGMEPAMLDTGAQKDIAELERMYALPDKRRKRKR